MMYFSYKKEIAVFSLIWWVIGVFYLLSGFVTGITIIQESSATAKAASVLWVPLLYVDFNRYIKNFTLGVLMGAIHPPTWLLAIMVAAVISDMFIEFKHNLQFIDIRKKTTIDEAKELIKNNEISVHGPFGDKKYMIQLSDDMSSIILLRLKKNVDFIDPGRLDDYKDIIEKVEIIQ
jgi:hypothetical protein